ncbi:hypothetical protein SAY86_022990 [Trapa natans]|uniref:Leucine-rich repeat-containing N-terminal plant-type domain-containing protein n=1 Tax=Trapa natans TaxID=22666 RepID=A0AAN7LUC7_TRANT|nr:hypothetical protein SAY86_022990 [Trapa natans]
MVLVSLSFFPVNQFRVIRSRSFEIESTYRPYPFIFPIAHLGPLSSIEYMKRLFDHRASVIIPMGVAAKRVISDLFWLILVSCIVLRASGNFEGDALNAFKSNLADPNNALQSWDPTLVNPCTWSNITCDSDNSVTRIDLGNANLSGQLVPQLGQLTQLQYLELYRNNISGGIPDELGNLTNLVSMDLYLNSLTGPIPTTLGKLSKLRFMRLNNNSLTGTIPMSLTTISTLQVLDLSYNKLTGDIPGNGSFSLFTSSSFMGNNFDARQAAAPPTSSAAPVSATAGVSLLLIALHAIALALCLHNRPDQPL